MTPQEKQIQQALLRSILARIKQRAHAVDLRQVAEMYGVHYAVVAASWRSVQQRTTPWLIQEKALTNPELLVPGHGAALASEFAVTTTRANQIMGALRSIIREHGSVEAYTAYIDGQATLCLAGDADHG